MKLLKIHLLALYKKELICCLCIFFVALGIRLEYQRNSVVRNHIISDAREYFLGAYNLCFFGIYSTQPPGKKGQPPKPNAGRTPGYSLFLYPFLCASKTLPDFLNKVMTAQAILGSFTSVMAFVIARFGMPLFLSLCAGMLTAFSPHLIAMDDYLLTESLFTFVMIAAFLCLIISIHKQGRNAFIASGLSGLFWGLSFLVKPMAMLLGPFMSIVYLLPLKKMNAFTFGQRLKLSFIMLLFFSIAISPYFLRNYLTLKQLFPEQGRGWVSIVDGTYINLIYKDPRYYGYPYKDDPLNSKLHADKKFFFETLLKRFKERPLDYVKWYLGGKILCSWRWDVVTGHHDVYVYPMKKFGFHNNKILFFIHSIMKMLHWPLFWMAVSAPVLFLLLRGQAVLDKYFFNAMPYLMILFYFFMIVTVMFPIPRYTIPIRPYVYNLALFDLFLFLKMLGKGYISSTG